MNYLPAIFFTIAGLSVLANEYGIAAISYADAFGTTTGVLFLLLGLYFFFSRRISRGITNSLRKTYRGSQTDESSAESSDRDKN